MCMKAQERKELPESMYDLIKGIVTASRWGFNVNELGITSMTDRFTIFIITNNSTEGFTSRGMAVHPDNLRTYVDYVAQYGEPLIKHIARISKTKLNVLIGYGEMAHDKISINEAKVRLQRLVYIMDKHGYRTDMSDADYEYLCGKYPENYISAIIRQIMFDGFTGNLKCITCDKGKILDNGFVMCHKRPYIEFSVITEQKNILDVPDDPVKAFAKDHED